MLSKIECCHNLLLIGIICTLRLIFLMTQSYHVRGIFFSLLPASFVIKVANLRMYSIQNFAFSSSFGTISPWNIKISLYLISLHSILSFFVRSQVFDPKPSPMSNFIHMTYLQMSPFFFFLIWCFHDQTHN